MSAAAVVIVAASVTSRGTIRASSPSAASWRAAAAPRSRSRAPSRTVCPDRPRAAAVANPIPLFAPVISTIFSDVSLIPARSQAGAGSGRASLRLVSPVPCSRRPESAILGDVEQTNRAELAAFLRHRRGQVRPADVGLAEGPRRRTPGLRRQEVAELASMSVDYYIRLEQARGPTPSPQMLASI